MAGLKSCDNTFSFLFKANERRFIAEKKETSPSSATRPRTRKKDSRLMTQDKNYQLRLTLSSGIKFHVTESPFLV
jgi:hypothetical protein